MLSVCKIRIYPNNIQKQKILQYFGSSKFIYNLMLHKKKAYKTDKTSLSSYELKKLLPQMKKSEAFEWLNAVGTTVNAS